MVKEVLGNTMRSINILLALVTQAQCTHTHSNVYMRTDRAVSVHQAYENKLYHINHINPLLFLAWPSLIPSSTLSSLLSRSAHQLCLLSLPLFPLIYPFNLACICVRWSMCSSSDERTSSTSPANQNVAGSSQIRSTYMPSRRYGKHSVILRQMLSKCPRAECIRPFLLWTLSDLMDYKLHNKGWSSHWTSIIN